MTANNATRNKAIRDIVHVLNAMPVPVPDVADGRALERYHARVDTLQDVVDILSAIAALPDIAAELAALLSKYGAT